MVLYYWRVREVIKGRIFSLLLLMEGSTFYQLINPKHFVVGHIEPLSIFMFSSQCFQTAWILSGKLMSWVRKAKLPVHKEVMYLNLHLKTVRNPWPLRLWTEQSKLSKFSLFNEASRTWGQILYPVVLEEVPIFCTSIRHFELIYQAFMIIEVQITSLVW